MIRGVSRSEISLNGNRKAASSAYADSVIANSSTPRTMLWRCPVMMESCFDLKRQGEVFSFCFHVFVRSTRYIIERIVPKTSPCFTPIIDSISASAPSIKSCTMMRCRAMISWMIFGGLQNLKKIQSFSMGPRSNALTKSTKRTHDSRLCYFPFFNSILRVKMASPVPHFERKPHCDSWSSSSTSGARRILMMSEIIFSPTSNIMMPL